MHLDMPSSLDKLDKLDKLDLPRRQITMACKILLLVDIQLHMLERPRWHTAVAGRALLILQFCKTSSQILKN